MCRKTRTTKNNWICRRNGTSQRRIVEHEDRLVNQRLTWLLTIQGFLLGGFFLIQFEILSLDVPVVTAFALESLLVFLFAVAAFICYVSKATIWCAYHTLNQAEKWWYSTLRVSRPRDTTIPWLGKLDPAQREGDSTETVTPAAFPPIIGRFKFGLFHHTTGIPVALFVVNVAICILCAALAYHSLTVLRGDPQQKRVKIEYVEKRGNGEEYRAEFLGTSIPTRRDAFSFPE